MAEIPVCMAPDPNTRVPKYRAPPNACDAHCHIFGPASRFPYAPERRYTPQDAGRETLAALHRHLGLERAILVQASCHGTDNRAMLDAVQGRSTGRPLRLEVGEVDASPGRIPLDLSVGGGLTADQPDDLMPIGEQ